MNPVLLDLSVPHVFLVYVCIFFLLDFYFMCVLPECMYVHRVCALCLERSEKTRIIVCESSMLASNPSQVQVLCKSSKCVCLFVCFLF